MLVPDELPLVSARFSMLVLGGVGAHVIRHFHLTQILPATVRPNSRLQYYFITSTVISMDIDKASAFSPHVEGIIATFSHVVPLTEPEPESGSMR